MRSIAEHISTISVSSERDGTGGFLNERHGRADTELKTARELFNAEFYARIDHYHYFPAFLRGTASDDILIFGEHPLFTRRWCFQERILSRRLIHYTKGELVWECNEDVKCECHGIADRPENWEEKASSTESSAAPKEATKERFNKFLRGLTSEPPLQIYNDLVHEYTSRKLSRETDTLPAFSAIARTFADAGLGEYCAGLWRSELVVMLCWERSNLGTDTAVRFSVAERAALKFPPLLFQVCAIVVMGVSRRRYLSKP